MTNKNAMLVVFSSGNPDEGGWSLVKPEDVPDSIKEPDVMGCLVAGELAKPIDGDLWYRAEEADALTV
jgi:hypothetical protein